MIAENPLYEKQLLAFSRMSWTREMVNDWLEDMYFSQSSTCLPEITP